MNASGPKASIEEEYRAAFLRRGFEILSRGYGRMNSGDFAGAQEPEITGELVRCMKEVIEDPEAPLWMIHFDVSDDPPLNTGERLGKKRRRVDIELFRTGRGLHPRVHLEAKRLCSASSVGEYTGKDGLGLFLAGEYGFQQNDGGMLGYVQRDSASFWNMKIEAALSDRKKFDLVEGGRFSPIVMVPSLKSMHRSIHRRSKGLDPITVYHTLLKFH